MFTVVVIALLAIAGRPSAQEPDASEWAARNAAVKVLDDASAALDQFVKEVRSQKHNSARQTLKQYVRDLERFMQLVKRVSPQAPPSFGEQVLGRLDSQITMLERIAGELNPGEQATERQALKLLRRALAAVLKYVPEGH